MTEVYKNEVIQTVSAIIKENGLKDYANVTPGIVIGYGDNECSCTNPYCQV